VRRFVFSGFVKNSGFVMIGMGWCTVLLLVCVVKPAVKLCVKKFAAFFVIVFMRLIGCETGLFG
jgi:hypothetical protein